LFSASFPDRSLAGGFERGMLVYQKARTFSFLDNAKRPGCDGIVFPHRVVRVDGDRLLVDCQACRGWVSARSFAPVPDAARLFSCAIECDRDDWFAYLMRGIIRERQGEDAGARADFSEAVRRSNCQTLSLLCRGRFRLVNGEA
jgi:hypothetical protein